MAEETFGDLSRLEDSFYSDGFKLGLIDGTEVGLIEGRVFGLEKGFEKFMEMGRLHGKAIVWASRLPPNGQPQYTTSGGSPLVGSPEKNQDQVSLPTPQSDSSEANISSIVKLPALADSNRLEKHIRTLYALSEPDSLSTRNNEDDVSEFDDRFKRAGVKAVMIGKLVNEKSLPAFVTRASSDNTETDYTKSQTTEAGIEDVNILHARH